LCPLHAKLARTYAMIETALRESTLRDLVETGDPAQRTMATLGPEETRAR
jgi:hypothetical protein